MTTLIVLALAPVILAFGVASFRDPIRIALPAYAVMIPFGSGFSIGLPGPFGSLSSLLGVLLALALLAQHLTVPRGTALIPATVPVWLSFLGLAGASVFWSVAPRTTAYSFAVLASLVLLYVLLAFSRIDRVDLTRVEDALVIGGVAAACYGIAQLLFLGGFPNPQGGAARFGNDLLGPNNQAAALLLPLVIAVARTAVPSGRGRLIPVIAVVVLLTGILMTGSRGGLVATVVALAAVVLFSSRGRGMLIGFSVASTVLLAAVLVFNPAGLGERQVTNESSSGRSDIWEVGLSACPTYCLTGSGWGTFPVVYKLEQPSAPEARVIERGGAWQPHNIAMLAGIETGVLGLLLVVVGLGLTMAGALRLPAALRAPPVAALFGTFVSSFFLSNLEFKFFWMVLIYVVLCQNYAAFDGASVAEKKSFETMATATPFAAERKPDKCSDQSSS
jgi:O-antigen ligase